MIELTLWHAQVNPNIRKEKWSEAEDVKLLKLVQQFGNAWAEISRRMDGRTDQQCMVRQTGANLLASDNLKQLQQRHPDSCLCMPP